MENNSIDRKPLKNTNSAYTDMVPLKLKWKKNRKIEEDTYKRVQHDKNTRLLAIISPFEAKQDD